METLGSIKVDGRTCFQVLLVRKSGEVFDEFYDAETGLLHQRRRRDEANGGSRQLLETYRDYRRFGNQLVPVRQVFTALEYREELTISKVEWDTVPERRSSTRRPTSRPPGNGEDPGRPVNR